MLFNSYMFILLFMPITVALYFGANKLFNENIGKLVLIVLSVLFLGYSGVYSVVILSISVLTNYCFGVALAKKPRRVVLLFGIVLNIAYLATFKYANFIIGNCHNFLLERFYSLNVILPIGISFYTFQQIAFLVDNYRGEAKNRSVIDYILFTTFFPKLLQGPIVYHDELIPQFCDKSRKKLNINNLCAGVYIFALGLGKKVILADNFGKIADYGFSSVNSLNSFDALLSVLAYTFQIYLDFSGYCDMAVGAAKMLNIDLPQNFNSPYKAMNISEFWKRWHMTLTRFLTKYIYIPLGGNRNGKVKTYVNIIIVFLVSGIWHGAGYTFIIWGMMHGIASVLYRLFKKTYDKIPKVFQWLFTYCFISVAWVFFRAPNASSAVALLSRVINGEWRLSINAELTESLLMPTLINIASQAIPFTAVIIAIFALTVTCIVVCRNSNELLMKFKPSVRNLVEVYLLLVIGILSLSGVSTFLYTNF